MKIAVAGTGYVGLSIATLLAQHNEVIAVDVIPEKVEKINKSFPLLHFHKRTELFLRIHNHFFQGSSHHSGSYQLHVRIHHQ